MSHSTRSRIHRICGFAALLWVPLTAWAQLPRWEYSGGPVDPITTQVVTCFLPMRFMNFAGTNGGLFSNIWSGNSWEQVEGVPAGAIKGLVAAGDGILVAVADWGLYISRDTGQVWEPRGNASFGASITALRCSPSGSVYAGTRDGAAFVSTDVGRSWNKVAVDNGHRSITSIEIDSVGTIFVGTNSGLLKASDGSVYFESIPLSNDTRVVHALVRDTRQRIYAGTDQGIYLSSDGGQRWSLRDSMIGSPDVLALNVTTLDSYAGPRELVIAGTNGTGLAWSYGGENWAWSTCLNGEPPPQYVTAVSTVDMAYQVLIGVYGHGVWGTVFNNLTLSMWVNTYRILIDDLSASASVLYAATVPTGVFKHIANDPLWVAHSRGLGRIPDSNYFSEGSLYVSHVAVDAKGAVFAFVGAGRSLYRSTDDGMTWTAGPAGLLTGFWSGSTSLVVDDSSNVYLASVPGVEKVSSDFIHHQLLSIGDSTCTGDKAIAINTHHHLFSTFGSCGLFRSRDYGITWTRLSISDSGRTLTPLHCATDSVLCGGTYVSRNEGDTWESLNKDTAADTVRFVIGHDNRNGIYAIRSSGSMALSRDFGRTWTRCDSGIPVRQYLKPIIQDSAGYLWVGSDSGVYRTVLSLDEIPREEALLPKNPSVLTLAPNPATDRAVITSSRTISAMCRVHVFNAIGGVINLDRVGAVRAGERNSITLHTSKLPRGIYWCRIEWPDEARTIPFAVIF